MSTQKKFRSYQSQQVVAVPHTSPRVKATTSDVGLIVARQSGMNSKKTSIIEYPNCVN